MSNTTDKFFSASKEGVLLHMESHTLKPSEIIEIYNHEKFELNKTEYEIFAICFFQKIEKGFVFGDLSVNNWFKIIHSLSVNLGLYYGKNGNNYEDILRDYEQLEHKFNSQDMDIKKYFDYSIQAITKTMNRVEEITPEKDTAIRMKKIFLSPIEAFEKLILEQ